MSDAINYLAIEAEAEQEQQALEELCAFLVRRGKYKDVKAANKDADERAEFLEQADFFKDDPRLADASMVRKATEALIQHHQLRELLSANDGRLPEAEQKSAGTGRRYSITEIFSAIELDLRTGMDQEQILCKLVDNGIARDNAEDALRTVLRQRQQKRRSRLYAVGTIIILSALLFLFSDRFSIF